MKKRAKIVLRMCALAFMLGGSLLADGCDTYDEVPPKTFANDYNLLPIPGESASAEEMAELAAIKEEYNTAVGN